MIGMARAAPAAIDHLAVQPDLGLSRRSWANRAVNADSPHHRPQRALNSVLKSD